MPKVHLNAFFQLLLLIGEIQVKSKISLTRSKASVLKIPPRAVSLNETFETFIYFWNIIIICDNNGKVVENVKRILRNN